MEIIPAVLEKIKAYRHAGQDIVFLRDTHFEDYLETREGRYLPVAHTIRGSHGWLVDDAIRAEIDTDAYPNLEKDTFACRALGDLIAGYKELPSIELVGICTGICVISNAFFIRALYPEADLSVDAACCSCVSRDSHEKALEIMKLCHIDIANG